MSAATTSDSSPQSLGSGSDRMVTIRQDSDRRSAVSSLDDMDAGYPSRLACLSAIFQLHTTYTIAVGFHLTTLLVNAHCRLVWVMQRPMQNNF